MSEIVASPPTPRVSPAIGISIGIAAISTASILVRFAQRDGAPSLTIAALRLVFASLVLLPFGVIRCRTELATLSRREKIVGPQASAINFIGRQTLK